MILKKLKEYLDSRNIKYTSISHSQAFTAQEVAMIAHIPGKELAKTVMVKVDGKMMMVVLPASDMVDLKLLRKSLGASTVALASEDEFNDLFPECERGAIPPFGNLFDLEVVVADDLAEDEKIAFNAGSHRELLKVAYGDYEQLVHPRVARISTRKRFAPEESPEYDMYDRQ